MKKNEENRAFRATSHRYLPPFRDPLPRQLPRQSGRSASPTRPPCLFSWMRFPCPGAPEGGASVRYNLPTRPARVSYLSHRTARPSASAGTSLFLLFYYTLCVSVSLCESTLSHTETPRHGEEINLDAVGSIPHSCPFTHPAPAPRPTFAPSVDQSDPPR